VCGICGEFKFNNEGFVQKKLDNLMNSISKRGNDSNGKYLDNNVFLGHHRLAIIDTSEKSNQPMKIENYVIVFNGVIFNYPTLKRELIKKGHSFESSGDTEVIIRAYIEFGEKCVDHFDGVFAFCIYDSQRNTIFLARDRIGIKPLYYLNENNEFYFSSHIKGIIKNMNSPQINPVALNYQFTLHSVVPAPHTIINNVKKLEPGYTLTISRSGDMRKRKYFDINEIEIKEYSNDEIKDNVITLLTSAIEKRINIADVPVGILLSGGLDSSLITAISKNYKDDLSTYSIGFNSINEEQGNEFYYSDMVARDYKTRHYKYNISNSDLLNSLDEVILNMSEPMFSQDSSAFYLLAKKVSESSKVVMSGQGADEVFGGYFWYKKMMEEKELTDIDTLIKYYFDRTFDNYSSSINKKYVTENFVAKDMKTKLDEMDSGLSTLDKVFRLELSTFIIDDPVKRVDNMTMSHSLEARVPFLDIDLINFMLTVKSDRKIMMDEKFFLKEVSKKFLKSDIINREKFYFPVPPLKIIKGEFYNYCKNILLSESSISRNLFEREYINKLLEEPNSNFTNLNGNELWHFTLLERWLQLNIEH